MKKFLVFFLLLLGVGLIFSGVFYNEIMSYLGLKEEPKKEKKKNPEVITCIKKDDNKEAELTESETSKMYFDSKGLIRIEDDVTISPIDNSQESLEKINRYYAKVSKFFEETNNKKGAINVKFDFKTNLIKYNMNIKIKDLAKMSIKDKEKSTEEDVIKVDEDGNALLSFPSIDTNYKSNFSYHMSYEKVLSMKKKDKYTCS